VKCVEVCPNRANTIVRVPGGFRDEYQVVHIDAFCNECGNCATFCPWEGRPYKDKVTVFATEEDFMDSTNPGFSLAGSEGKIRVGDAVGRLSADGSSKLTSEVSDGVAGAAEALAVAQAIVRGYRYLLGESR
jgi:putative selenate reductase